MSFTVSLYLNVKTHRTAPEKNYAIYFILHNLYVLCTYDPTQHDTTTQVEYIQYIKSIPSEEGRLAEMALFRRQPEEAERILLQSSPPLVHRAIKLNLSLYKWSRALDLAIKYRSHVDTVLGYRQRHLDEFNKQEKNAKFLQYAAEVKTFLFLLYFYFLWQ